METLDQLIFDSGKEGPSFLALGAIHGNEKCGTVAIGRIAMELRSGIFSLTSGKLTVVPVCNPEAYRRNVRFVEANLNRVITDNGASAVYEHKLAHQVMKKIDAADIVLDLHSYGSGSRPFLFLDNDTPDHRAYATALGIPFWVTGWNDIYVGQEDLNAGDTMSYTHGLGKTGILVECGAHEDPAAAFTGYLAIRRALAHFGMTAAFDGDLAHKPLVNKLYQIVAKEKEGDFIKEWQHLDPVRKGDTVATFSDGSVLAAPIDGVIILPKKAAKVGDEWLYFGQTGS